MSSTSLPTIQQSPSTMEALNDPGKVPPTSSTVPQQLSEHLLQASRGGRYWSITTMPAPFAPWSPNPVHGEKETRACHCSRSRVHKLICGHLVAVEGDAEQCAPNCFGNDLDSFVDAHVNSRISSATHDVHRPRKAPAELHQDAAIALQVYHQTFTTPATEKAWKSLKSVAERMFMVHQLKDLKNTLSGNFTCQECAVQAERPSVPAFIYRKAHVSLILPIRDSKDQDTVKLLKAGVKPEFSRRLNYRKPQPVRDQGRITRRRVKEKKRVLQGLQEESVLEDIEAMQLF